MQGVAGTVAYMAPEQLRGMPVKASDQYALAAVMYEWLSGKSPFQGSFVEVATQHTLTPPPSLRDQVPTIKPAVESAILKALSKDPAQRFASVQEFADAFAQGIFDGETHTVQPDEEISSKTEPLPARQDVNVLPLQETTITTYRGHTAPVNAVVWSPSDRHEAAHYRSRVASGSDDGTIQIWDAITGRKISTHRGHSGGISSIAWSPDGKWIASAGIDCTVQVWAADTMRKICTYTRHSDKVTAVAWSPARLSSSAGQGFLVASAGDDGTVQIWDATTGHRQFIYRDHLHPVHAVAWSPDGTRIASASFDRTVQIWDAATGENAVSYPGHSNRVHAVAWAKSGQYIVSASSDKTVQVWLAV